MELALLNLALNARDAMPEGGTLAVETQHLYVSDGSEHPHVGAGNWAVLSITDTGLGMSQEVLMRAFDPFFTTKEVGKGSGLGLSMVYGLVKQHGAEIALTSEVGKGTSIQLFFPSVQALPARAKVTRPATGSIPSHARVLVVDDDPDVLQFMLIVLKEAGHTVTDATGGRSALDRLDQHEALDLVVLDYAMPRMNGAVVAREIRARRPGIPILFVTGFADGESAEGELDGQEILHKPFRAQELLDRVHNLVAASGGSATNTS
jgi:CheY-like chemotaxis protein